MSLTQLDANQVIRAVFDEVTSALKTKTEAVVSGGTDIVITQADDSIQTAPFRGTLTDRSGTATTTTAQVAAANTSRKYFFIQNLDASIAIYINFGSAATTGSGSIKLSAGASFVMEDGFISTQAINVISASGSVTYTAKEG